MKKYKQKKREKLDAEREMHGDRCACGHAHESEPGSEHDRALCAEHREHTEQCGHDCEHEHVHTEKRGNSHDEGAGCDCCSNTRVDISHTHDESVDKRVMIFRAARVAAAIVLTLIAVFVPMHVAGSITLYVAAYIICGAEYLLKTVKNLAKGRIFDENFLMTLATIGAFAIGEYAEAVGVMALYGIGETFQDLAVMRSKKSIVSLMDLKVNRASKLVDGAYTEIDTDDLRVGDIVMVRSGERAPVDGAVIDGASYFDESAITGESVPVAVKVGNSVRGGGINKGDAVTLRVEKEFKDTTVNKIMQLVESAQDRKPKTEQMITKFAKYYTPIVVLAAVIVAFVPPIFVGELTRWVNLALVFLVISCPCAIVISVPLTYFAGIGGASRRGVLVKGGNYLEALNGVDRVVFDKTGTLTKGVFKVTETEGDGVLELAAKLEVKSTHPIARSVLEAYGKSVKEGEAVNVAELAGRGMRGEVNGREILVGNAKLMKEYGIDFTARESGGTTLYVAAGGMYVGRIVISDEIKDSSRETVEYIKKTGRKVAMMTGDNESSASRAAGEIGIEEYYAGLLPQDKAARVEEYIAAGEKVLFVGDGINDAPVLAGATVGACVGGVGNDASVEASDMVLMRGEPSEIKEAFKTAKKTRKLVIENVALALGVKLIIVVLNAVLTTSLWLSIIADVGVCLVAVLNSLRAVR